jgi:hypothetical protein
LLGVGVLAGAVGITAVGRIPAARAQQIADSTFAPDIGKPAFAKGQGPLVLLDEAHHNFHTKSGRYAPFARLLESDGFVVRPNTQAFTAASLAGARVLVVSNAIHASNDTSWVVPTPSAFTPEEIGAVRAYVEGGGALFLIADHMPFAGAATDLGQALGVTFDNGFAALPGPNPGAPAIYRRDASSGARLASHAITAGGKLDATSIDSVATFTGSAFRPPEGAVSLLTFPDSAYSLAPDTAWVFSDRTRRTDIGGWSQGAVFALGKGRVAVFGEAAMFSAQIAGGGTRVGMNAPVAAQNPLFLARLVRWLATGSPWGGAKGAGDPRGQSSASK